MKPNILFLMTDQHVWHAIGKIGQWVETPNLDSLCEAGVVFENCYTNSPLCLPARASLATGLYPHNLDIDNNASRGLDLSSKTWMQILRNNGYSTSAFGKLHLHRWSKDLRDDLDKVHHYGYEVVDEIPGPRTYGIFKSNLYDLYEEKNLLDLYNEDVNRRYKNKVYDATPSPLPLEYYSDVYVGNKAVEYLENYSDSKPWFCTVSFGGPHEPWDAPKEYVQRYRPKDMPKPLPKPIDSNPDRVKGVYDEILNGQYDFALNQTVKNMTPDDIADLRANYAAKVTLIDEQIGRILKVIKQRNEYDNTIIVFTSDHGEQNGDYELIFKQTFLNSSVKVPLIIKPADIKYTKVKSYSQNVELIDIGSTIVDMVGLTMTYEQYGRSLCPLMCGKTQSHRESILSELYNEWMIIYNNYKAVFNCDGNVYMLFNLLDDPDERLNLAGDSRYIGIENQIKAALIKRLSETKLFR